MKKFESRMESLETEISELKSMVSFLVDNHQDRIHLQSTAKDHSSNQQAGRDLSAGRDMAGRDINYSPVFNIYLNGDEGELLSLLQSVQARFP